jgi:hypothetical protein
MEFLCKIAKIESAKFENEDAAKLLEKSYEICGRTPNYNITKMAIYLEKKLFLTKESLSNHLDEITLKFRIQQFVSRIGKEIKDKEANIEEIKEVKIKEDKSKELTPERNNLISKIILLLENIQKNMITLSFIIYYI